MVHINKALTNREMAVFDNIEIGKRVQKLAKSLNMSGRQLAESLEANTSYWNKIERGVKPISEKYMEELRNRYNVNLVWLLFGKEEMFVPIGTKEKPGTVEEPDLLTRIKDHANGILISLEMLARMPLDVPGKETTLHPRGRVQRANTLDRTKTEKKPKGT